jgi:hypothetical protein
MQDIFYFCHEGAKTLSVVCTFCKTSRLSGYTKCPVVWHAGHDVLRNVLLAFKQGLSLAIKKYMTASPSEPDAKVAALFDVRKFNYKGLRHSVATVKRHIQVLKKLGYLERIGSNKSGHWKITKQYLE